MLDLFLSVVVACSSRLDNVDANSQICSRVLNFCPLATPSIGVRAVNSAEWQVTLLAFRVVSSETDKEVVAIVGIQVCNCIIEILLDKSSDSVMLVQCIH